MNTQTVAIANDREVKNQFENQRQTNQKETTMNPQAAATITEQGSPSAR